jgi:hypothetical protein
MRVKESPVNDKPTPSPQASARRRLLRGAFSAPAVLTLYSGSAMATKSHERCLKNVIGNNPGIPGPSSKEDGWYRCELRKRTTTIDSKSVTEYWLFSNDLAVVATKRSILTYPNQAQRFGVTHTGDSKFVANALYRSVRDTSGLQGPFSMAGKYVALKVDDTGTVVGVGHSGTGTAVSQSCWNSFKMGGG